MMSGCKQRKVETEAMDGVDGSQLNARRRGRVDKGRQVLPPRKTAPLAPAASARLALRQMPARQPASFLWSLYSTHARHAHTSPMGQKRTFTEAMEDSTKPQQASPFLPMFEVFRAELDEHHDRRERIIKGSRDITAASKKM